MRRAVGVLPSPVEFHLLAPASLKDRRAECPRLPTRVFSEWIRMTLVNRLVLNHRRA